MTEHILKSVEGYADSRPHNLLDRVYLQAKTMPLDPYLFALLPRSRSRLNESLRRASGHTDSCVYDCLNALDSSIVPSRRLESIRNINLGEACRSAYSPIQRLCFYELDALCIQNPVGGVDTCSVI